MEHSNPREFQKLPVNADTPPAEFSQLPAEYAAPQEFPGPQTVKKEQKKQSSARKMLALCAAGVVVLQLMFGYIFPVEKPISEEDSDYFDEIYFGINPRYDPYHDPGFPTDLNVRKPKQDSNITNLLEQLDPICERMYLGEYTLAAMLLLDALDDFAYHSGSDDLNELVMVWEDGEVELFDCQDLRKGDGVYIFFYPSMYYYSAKESYDLAYGFEINVTLLVSEKTSAGDHVRMLTVTTEEFMLMSNVSSCSAEYLETTFDENYNASNVERIGFGVSSPYYSDGDTPHDRIHGDVRLVGDLKQDAFVGDVEYYFSGSQLNKDGTRMIPLEDSPRALIKLTEYGKVDAAGMGLLDSAVLGTDSIRDTYNQDLSIPGYIMRYEELSVFEIRCEDYENLHMTLYDEFKNNTPLFTTGKSVEFWRVIQSHLDK